MERKRKWFSKRKKYQEAAECYSKVIDLDPKPPILYSNIQKFD